MMPFFENFVTDRYSILYSHFTVEVTDLTKVRLKMYFYDGIVEQKLEHLFQQLNKFRLKKAKVFIEHAKGYVPLGKPSIIIAVSCKHRSEAYQLSRYLIEQIKIRAPIWKKEYYKNQKSEWLKGTSIKVK